jgi:hypothetical protein
MQTWIEPIIIKTTVITTDVYLTYQVHRITEQVKFLDQAHADAPGHRDDSETLLGFFGPIWSYDAPIRAKLSPR